MQKYVVKLNFVWVVFLWVVVSCFSNKLCEFWGNTVKPKLRRWLHLNRLQYSNFWPHFKQDTNLIMLCKLVAWGILYSYSHVRLKKYTKILNTVVSCRLSVDIFISQSCELWQMTVCRKCFLKYFTFTWGFVNTDWLVGKPRIWPLWRHFYSYREYQAVVKSY